MRPVFAATLISLTVALGGINAAYAQDKDSSAATAPAATDAKGTEGSAAGAQTKGSNSTSSTTTSGAKPGGLHFPTLRRSVSSGSGNATTTKSAPKANLGARMASTMVGGVFGIPVSMVRRTKTEVISATKELVDNSNNKFYLAAASPIGLVGGIVSGCFQGAVFGPYNAWKYSADQPFGAETFSLGDAK